MKGIKTMLFFLFCLLTLCSCGKNPGSEILLPQVPAEAVDKNPEPEEKPAELSTPLSYAVNQDGKTLDITLEDGTFLTYDLGNILEGMGDKERLLFADAVSCAARGNRIRCFLPGDPAVILWTEDKGQTWRQTALDEIHGAEITKSLLGFFGEKGGWLWAQGSPAMGQVAGSLYTTRDGTYWYPGNLYGVEPRPLEYVDFLSERTGFLAVGDGREGVCPYLYYSYTGGESWEPCEIRTSLTDGYLTVGEILPEQEGFRMVCQVVGGEGSETRSLYSGDGQLWQEEKPWEQPFTPEEQAVKERLLAADNPDGVEEGVLNALTRWLSRLEDLEGYLGGSDWRWRLESRPEDGYSSLIAESPLTDGFGDRQYVFYQYGLIHGGPSGYYQAEIRSDPRRWERLTPRIDWETGFISIYSPQRRKTVAVYEFESDLREMDQEIKRDWSGTMCAVGEGERVYLLLPLEQSLFLWTDNGGQTWMAESTGFPGQWAEEGSMGFVNESVGWIHLFRAEGGLNGPVENHLYLTQDGGVTWTEGNLTALEPTYITYLTFLAEKEGYLVLEQKIPYGGQGEWRQENILYRTQDGGQTWEQGEFTCPADLVYLHPDDVSRREEGWILTCHGMRADYTQKVVVYHSGDGIHWEEEREVHGDA